MIKREINFNRPVTRDHLNLKEYNAKFKFIDRIKGIKKPHPKYLARIIDDPTLYSYMYFKLNGKPLSLFPYQDIILNDPHNRKILRSARQLGKSLSLDVKSAVNLCKDHGHHHNECIISKSLEQAKFQMRRVKQLLNNARFNWHESKGDVDNVSTVSVDWKDEEDTTYEAENRPQRIKYSNLLIVTPCTTGALGYDFHEVNLDEIEYWEDIDVRNFMNNIIEPTTLTTNGNITTFSNPNGSETYIAELERLKDKNGDCIWHTYVFDVYDYPNRTKDEAERLFVGKTRQEIESQYLAVRTLSDKYYFTADEIESSISQKITREQAWYASGKESYWFLDVGAKRDQSCLCGAIKWLDPDKKDATGNPLLHIDVFKVHNYPVGYPISRVVGSFDDSQATDGWHHEKSVKEYLEEHQLVKGVIPIFGVDVTGNSGISPLFNSVGIHPIDITFSGPKKWAMYQRMKYFLEQKLLHVVKHNDYSYQMKRIVVTKLKTSTYNRVGHEFDDEHDDVPDSVSGVIHLADNPALIEPSLKFIPY